MKEIDRKKLMKYLKNVIEVAESTLEKYQGSDLDPITVTIVATSTGIRDTARAIQEKIESGYFDKE